MEFPAAAFEFYSIFNIIWDLANNSPLQEGDFGYVPRVGELRCAALTQALRFVSATKTTKIVKFRCRILGMGPRGPTDLAHFLCGERVPTQSFVYTVAQFISNRVWAGHRWNGARGEGAGSARQMCGKCVGSGWEVYEKGVESVWGVPGKCVAIAREVSGEVLLEVVWSTELSPSACKTLQ